MTKIDGVKRKMRARSMSLTGRLSLKEDEDEPSVCVCVGLCIYIPVCMCTLTTASSCHCQCLMELPVGQHFINSVALSIANPSLTLCACVWVRRCERVYECLWLWAIVRHHCHALPHVNLTRKRDIYKTMANCLAEVEIRDCQCHELPLPSCRRCGMRSWSSLTPAPHVHSKPNETLHSFPHLSPPPVS